MQQNLIIISNVDCTQENKHSKSNLNLQDQNHNTQKMRTKALARKFKNMSPQEREIHLKKLDQNDHQEQDINIQDAQNHYYMRVLVEEPSSSRKCSFQHGEDNVSSQEKAEQIHQNSWEALQNQEDQIIDDGSNKDKKQIKESNEDNFSKQEVEQNKSSQIPKSKPKDRKRGNKSKSTKMTLRERGTQQKEECKEERSQSHQNSQQSKECMRFCQRLSKILQKHYQNVHSHSRNVHKKNELRALPHKHKRPKEEQIESNSEEKYIEIHQKPIKIEKFHTNQLEKHVFTQNSQLTTNYQACFVLNDGLTQQQVKDISRAFAALQKLNKITDKSVNKFLSNYLSQLTHWKRQFFFVVEQNMSNHFDGSQEFNYCLWQLNGLHYSFIIIPSNQFNQGYSMGRPMKRMQNSQ